MSESSLPISKVGFLYSTFFLRPSVMFWVWNDIRLPEEPVANWFELFKFIQSNIIFRGTVPKLLCGHFNGHLSSSIARDDEASQFSCCYHWPIWHLIPSRSLLYPILTKGHSNWRFRQNSFCSWRFLHPKNHFLLTVPIRPSTWGVAKLGTSKGGGRYFKAWNCPSKCDKMKSN